MLQILCFIFCSSGDDFGDATMFLMFPANSPINTQRCTNFVTVDDNVVEVTEDFTVTATGAAFVHEQSSIQVTLQDNDGELDNYVALQLSVVSNVLIL